MTLQKLPSGRWRARIWHEGKDQSVAKILGLPSGTSWPTKREARDAHDEARRKLREAHPAGQVTVMEFWERWTSEKMFMRPKASTNRHNRERTKAFAEKHGTLRLDRVTRQTVGEWRSGGSRDGTIPALRAMWNDALRLELVERNPFSNQGITKSRGNRDSKPPAQSVVWDLVKAARRLSGPSFAAWLQVAAFTGMRPGELDALQWTAVDFDRNRIHVNEQWNETGGFTLPKNGFRREAPLTPPARDALLSLPREAEFCFVNLRGQHWSSSSRAYHWKAVKAAVGFEGSLYVATRHHAGDYMTNVLGLAAEDVAIALGHRDGGYLVRTLYGHRDEQLALDRVVSAYESRANVVPLPKREEETA